MKRFCRVAARLYPAEWRRRYGRELEALLEDMEPGWRELVDLFCGALTMQIRTLAVIPLVCTLAGAVAGGVMANRTPTLFASSATVRVTGGDIGNPASAAGQKLRASLQKALGESGGTERAVSVRLLGVDSTQTTLGLTSKDRDPARAQRVAENMTAAIASAQTPPVASAEVLDAPGFPTSPMKPEYPMPVAVGGVVGLVAGGVALLLLRARPSRASAG
jgi:hypothetical protein